jgi:hypothetical protein
LISGRLPPLLLVLTTAACGHGAGAPADASADAGLDAGPIADAMSEQAPDAAADVARETADSAPDLALDAAPDVVPDAPHDVAADAASDVSSGAACALLASSCLNQLFAAAAACFAPAGPCTRADAAGTTTYCWQNGARYVTATSGSVVYTTGGAACVHGSRDASMFSLILDTDPAFPLYYFAFATGDTACQGTPGRTTVDPSIAACPSFQALVSPDVGACTPGACN